VTLGAVAGVVSTLLGIAFVWPQVFRVHRERSVEGLSLSTNLANVSGAILWTVFGLASGRTIAFVANVSVGIGLVMITAMFVRQRVVTMAKTMIVIVGTMATCGLLLAFSTRAIGVIGLVVSSLAILPQLWRALTSVQLHGVSVSANLLLCATAIGWFIYGLEVAEPLYVYPNGILVPCTLAIALRAWLTRESRAHLVE
jgi:uncharacterized protein with PQ loop repeat